MQTVADSLGRVVGNLVNLLNPRLVVMGGSLEKILHIAQNCVEKALDLTAMAAARGMVELRPSSLGEDGSLLGAAELAFVPLLADPLGAVASLPDPVVAPAG